MVTPAIDDVADATLDDFGRYERLVPLETRDDVLLGSVDRIVVDPRTGDLLVADFRSSRRVFRFDPDGRYLTAYGDPTLDGEHSYVTDVAVLGDGRVLMLAGNRGLVFEPDGTLADTLFFRFAADEVVALGERFYVRGHSVTQHRLDDAVHAFGLDLLPAGSFHPYDRRRDRFAFIPRRSLAVAGDTIYVSELYDFRVAAYDADGRPGPIYDFPDHNAELAELWRLERAELTDEHRARLRDGIHRTRSLLALGDDSLFFVESQIARQISHPALFRPAEAAVRRFPDLWLIESPHGPGSDDFLVDQLVGAYDGGLLGICDDPARLERFRDRLELLRGVDYQVTDNPLVLFLRVEAAPAAGGGPDHG